LITAGRKSAPLSGSNQLIGPADRLFIEKGAEVECAILNTKNGPIYIGRNALVMEGAMIRGAFAMGEDSVLKMGAKIYGATTLGPGCKVGGEVNNSVFQANSNKGHDGYLGNSVLGEWCNIGADTNCSNLKNTYEEVKLWNYPAGRFVGTGLQFCGLILADHVKVGINTMFNTGTVVGVAANVFGTGFPRNFIPSFSWGGPQGYSTYRTTKAFAMMERVLERRQQELSVQDRLILLRVFEDTAKYRDWDK
jgi:UDP-N-acetylglucosamine diphosphorylase/glucosamine-1-phosphate N-acetyltransferase